MHLLAQFSPIFLFVFIFVGSGVYFSIRGEQNAFSLLSPVTAIIPAIILAWIRNEKSSKEKMSDFLNGIGHEDISCMCVIFLLAGAFGNETKFIGSAEAAINLLTPLIPANFLLIGVFIISALLSTSIGTAIGTIAAVGPIAAELSAHAVGLPAPLSMGAVVGGAMFGDNLSLISDTTIAAISTQGADVRKKFKINLRIASIASIIAALFSYSATNVSEVNIGDSNASLLLILPYIAIIVLAFSRVNVFACLMFGTVLAGIIGYSIKDNYGIIDFSNNINEGFRNVNSIMLLALMIGGLSGLVGNDAMKEIAHIISAAIAKRETKSNLPQFAIAGLASISTRILANNVIAIILCGKIAKFIAKNNNISPHYSATILEVFACAVKGLLPYGAQVLLAASIANISPLSIVPHVYYCYALIVVSIVFIAFKDKRTMS